MNIIAHSAKNCNKIDNFFKFVFNIAEICILLLEKYKKIFSAGTNGVPTVVVKYFRKNIKKFCRSDKWCPSGNYKIFLKKLKKL